jgi:3,4-dihydroxy-2-butanone 4-phosphate synthase
MFRLIGIIIIITIILVGVDYVITANTYQTERITVVDKYTDGNICSIKTVSLQQFNINCDIYNKFDIERTYFVKVSGNTIKQVV